jgi:hypothetical protein
MSLFLLIVIWLLVIGPVFNSPFDFRMSIGIATVATVVFLTLS